jgi:hypothetical protein
MDLAPDEIEAMAAAVAQSDPALLFSFGAQPLWIVGFIPTAIITPSAYAWMQWSPKIYDHRIGAARACRDLFLEIRKRYPRIYGHCTYGPVPTRLLTRLGARFYTDLHGRPAYIMGDEA